MKKNQIISYIQTLQGITLTPTALKIISNSLNDNTDYKIEQNDNNFKIHTDIIEAKSGSYFEIIHELDNETKEISLVVTKKEYDPKRELRYGFMQEVGLNMFTKSESYVFNKNDMLLYKSFFSDDNKYYENFEMPLDFSKKSLLRYFDETTPKFYKGRLIHTPKSSYQPFKHIWQRYGNTHVVKTYGRNPMEGEYSYICLTFDDNSRDDIRLLSESNGEIYSYQGEMKMNSEETIVTKIEQIEQIYQNSTTQNGFDYDNFNAEFEESMLRSKKL